MPHANNSPASLGRKTDFSIEEKRQLLALLDNYRRMKPVCKDDIEEINNRLDYFFRSCSENGILPTVEAMSLCLGISRVTVWEWQKSDCEAGQIVGRAKELINAFLSTATTAGKANPIYSIWLQKNHFNYSDKQEIEVSSAGKEETVLPDAELPKLSSFTLNRQDEYLPRLDEET